MKGCKVRKYVWKREIDRMIVSIHLSEEENQLFKNYAEFTEVDLSTLFKRALLEKIEDEFDLKVGQKALAEYKQDPVTYSVAEMRAKYGL